VKSFKVILKFTLNKEYVSMEEYIQITKAKHVAFIFDGFDEYPSSLLKDSFITNIIKGIEIIFKQSIIVFTSRPTATLSLHTVVDRRIEILGFAKEDRDRYISQY